MANLLHFADLTHEQRIQWLADMLELMQLARRADGRDPTLSTPQSPSD